MIKIKTILLLGLIALGVGCSQEQSPKVVVKEKLIDEKITLLENISPRAYGLINCCIADVAPYIEAVDFKNLAKEYNSTMELTNNGKILRVQYVEGGSEMLKTDVHGKLSDSSGYLIFLYENGGGSLTTSDDLVVDIVKRKYVEGEYALDRLYLERIRKNKEIDTTPELNKLHPYAIYTMLEENNYGVETINEVNYLALNNAEALAYFEYKNNSGWFELYDTKDKQNKLIFKYKINSIKNGRLELTTSVLTAPHDEWRTTTAWFQFFKTDEKDVKTIRCLGWKLIK